MALGRQIVSELGLEPGVDTLSKWMAHHIAELITDAESQTDPEAKRKKETQAAESISKLWQHRSKYDNRINPLHDLKPILQVLQTLDPNRNVWITNFGGPDGKAFAQVYDAVRRLVILMIIKKSGDTAKAGTSTSAHQDADEKEITATINAWLDDKQKARLAQPRETKQTGKAREPKNKAQSKDPDALAKSLIEHARKALDHLSDELVGKTAKNEDELI